MGTVVLNREKRQKAPLHIPRRSDISGTACHDNYNSCRRERRCGEVCRNCWQSKESSKPWVVKKSLL
jgi:hypothetical protein